MNSVAVDIIYQGDDNCLKCFSVSIKDVASLLHLKHGTNFQNGYRIKTKCVVNYKNFILNK